MSGNLHHPPQQHAGKAQGLRPQLSHPTVGLRHDFGMHPHPPMAQHQRYAPKQQTQGRFAAPGAAARLRRLPMRGCLTLADPREVRLWAMKQPSGAWQK
jgi:hypothetical protein